MRNFTERWHSPHSPSYRTMGPGAGITSTAYASLTARLTLPAQARLVGRRRHDMANRGAMKLFAVAVLASTSTAHAGTTSWASYIDKSIKPRQLANGRAAPGNT